MQYLTSGEIAKLLNITKYLLRHYEEQQLIKPAFIDVNGYHMYGENEVYVMTHILLLKDLGFSLKEIKRILNKETDYTEVLNTVLIKVETDIKRLSRLKDSMQTILEMQQKEPFRLKKEDKPKRYFSILADEYVDGSHHLNLKKLANWKNRTINIMDEISYAVFENGSKVKVLHGSNEAEADFAVSAGIYYCKRIRVEHENELIQEIEHFYNDLAKLDAEFEDRLFIHEEAQLSAFYIDAMVYCLEAKAK